MDPGRHSNFAKGFEAPVPPPPTDDYAQYAKNYRVYLQLLSEFNDKSFTTVERPASQHGSVYVTFAEQVQTNQNVPEKYVVRKQRQELGDKISNAPVSPSGYAKGLVSSGKLRRASNASSSQTAVEGDVTIKGSRAYNTARINQIANNPQTMYAKPSESDASRNMLDVVDRELYDYMKMSGRLPKSFRSLANLREMAERKCAERSLPRLTLNDWKVVTRT